MHSKQQKLNFKGIRIKHKSILSWMKNDCSTKDERHQYIQQKHTETKIDFNSFYFNAFLFLSLTLPNPSIPIGETRKEWCIQPTIPHQT